MKKIDRSFVMPLLRGSSLLACGGGLPFGDQRLLLQRPDLKLAIAKGIKLLQLKNLRDTDVCLTISEVGAASAPVMDKTLLPAALGLFEQRTGLKVRAIIPGEIGQEAITIESACRLKLPIVNTDLSGCRAVPRLTDLALVVQQQAFTMSPCVIVTNDGQLTFIEQQASLEDDERLIRSLVPTGEVVTMIGGMVRGNVIKRFLRYSSYTTARRLGHAIKHFDTLLSKFPTEILLPPTTAVVREIEEIETQGFNQKKVKLTADGQDLEIEVENEYMRLTTGEQIFSFPQLIMVADRVLQRGLHSSELQVGQEVEIFVADAFDFWKGINS